MLQLATIFQMRIRIIMNSARRGDKKDTPNDVKAEVLAAIPTTAVGVSAGVAAVAATATLHPLFNQKAAMQGHMFPYLDSKALACLLRVSAFAKKITQDELDQRNAKKIIDLTLRGEVSELFLMLSPARDHRPDYQTSDERDLYLYKKKDGRVFYYYKEDQKKHYLLDEKQQPVKVDSHFSFESTPENRQWCVDEALRKSVFDITTKRKHTLRSDSEEIKKMVDENQRLSFVVYHPKAEADKTLRNKGGQLISMAGKTPLQVAFGEEHDYAQKAMTSKLLVVKDEKQRVDNEQKIQAQRDAQYAPGSKQEEKEKAERLANVLATQAELTRVILESKPGNIQDSGPPNCKLTLAGKGGAAIAAAVAQFEASLKAVRDTAVRTGCHYHPEPHSKALEEYEGQLMAGKVWNSPEMQFLWRSIGHHQRMMSLGYGHGFGGDGLAKNIENLQKGQTPRESTAVVVWDSGRQNWGDARCLYSFAGLGFDFAIGWGGRCAPLLAGCRAVGARAWFSLFKSYVNQKQQTHRTVMPQQRDRRPEPPKSSCVMM